MKKILTLIFSMALCLTIAACSSNQAVTEDERDNATPSASETPTETPKETPTVAPTETPEETDEPAEALEDMYNAYADALENLTNNHILPDGTEAAEPFGDMAQNKFALYDVDNDGKEELLLMYSDTYSAGMVGYVLAYDAQTKKLQTELREFPALTFYDNGIIKAGWSHNQGRAGDNFWPYNLYQYAPETDSYELVGMVDAWDKNYPGGGASSDPFPSDVDKSGTGYVYYIMKDMQYDASHPVDASEYNAWVDSYLKNASEIQIEYMDLTKENIAQIRNG